MSAPSELPENLLLAAWQETLRRCGPAVAILSEKGETLRTFEAIEREAAAWSGRLALPPGAVVAIQMGARPEWPALILACLRRCWVAMPLGRHLGAEEREAALAIGPASALVECRGEELRVTSFETPPPRWPEPAPHFLKLTSGTTAAPRAIRFRAGQLLEDGLQICETMGIGEGDLNYAAIPLSHSYGFSNLILPLLIRGVPMAVSDDRMPRAILAGLAATGATVFPGMPVFFDKFADLEEPPPLPRLRLCISAGAPLPAEVGRRFTARYGLKIHPFYGSSECGGIAYDADDSSGYCDGFVGKPMSRVRLEALPEGTLRVCGGAVADGYWPVESGPLRPGCFIPGDLVRLEPEAGLFLEGRFSDIINVAGRKLNPREVEAQLLRFPGVREAVVFGVPSFLRNEEPVACITGSAEPRELLQFARTLLSGWQVPKEVWKVGELPVSDRGKISRRELARRYQAMRNSPHRP